MNDLEAKMRCLELAFDVNKPSGEYTAKKVVDIAKELYTFLEPQAEKPVVNADKSGKRRGRPPKQ
jgi:hypothetical protein